MRILSALSLAMGLLFTLVATAQQPVTTPLEEFGFNVGDDYQLLTYSQLEAYWKKLETESPRMQLEAMGKTAEGRTQWMAIVTAPQNFEHLEEYKQAARKLALAKDLSEEEARALSKTTKAVIWIDGGLHASEVVGAHQLTQMVYEMLSRNDEETLRFLDDVVILFAHANPDGMELQSSWYMREEEEEKRSTRDLPRLYQKYVGHDNNRDSYALNQPETRNIADVMYRRWFPQIMYNHHQTGPQDIIIFVPPFRDPPNYNFDPLLVLGNQTVGLAMHSRLVAAGKPGSGARDNANYSTWFNGNIRTVGYFHNQIGILTEIKGNPTPMELGFWPDKQLPSNDYVMPHWPGAWHFADAIEYSIILNRAVLDYASRNRETILFNRWRMGQNSIERGSRDNWTIHPRIVYDVEAQIRADGGEDAKFLEQTFRRRGDGVSKDYLELFRKPENRDPRGYIIPAHQRDFPTAVKFLNALIRNGITVHQAREDFEVAGKQYGTGSFVVMAAQAFRPHVIDMFEPQDHPDDFLYDGGPPIPPYDNAGYTLAIQMGVEFDRILDGFDGPFEEVTGLARPLAGHISGAENPTGYLTSHAVNDSVIAVNRLLASGHDVYWLKEDILIDGQSWKAGTIYIGAGTTTGDEIGAIAAELGLSFRGVESVPAVAALKLNQVRVGLWDRFGGSMPSGWTRWLMEQFEFPYERVFPKELDAGGLNARYDVLVFVDGALEAENQSPRRNDDDQELDPESVPAEYLDHMGDISREITFPNLREFVDAGGSLLAIGSSIDVAQDFGLPLSDHMVDGNGDALKNQDYFVPSSILEVRVDNTQPIAYGIPGRAAILSDKSPVMRLKPEADKQGVTPIAWFDSDRPLRSGWAWGQDRLFGGTAIAESRLGEGRLYLFGPEILYRGQSHGTFQFFFNGLYLSNAEEVRLGE